VVTAVDEDGPSAGKLSKGDIITTVNRSPIKSIADYTAAMADAQKSGKKYVIVGYSHNADNEWMDGRVDIEPAW